ncbi:hypothetical protein ACF3MZ_00185 [Paenibacillaceae bacterium WGS1546]|uniref:hypothetical protein n=1 Tax=Cohnella sp. WGS1546 TaxID=3366810 RepID=UPI00372D1AAF
MACSSRSCKLRAHDIVLADHPGWAGTISTLLIERESDVSKLRAVGVAKAAGHSFAFTINRYDNLRDRLFAKFLVVLHDPAEPDSARRLIPNKAGSRSPLI